MTDGATSVGASSVMSGEEGDRGPAGRTRSLRDLCWDDGKGEPTAALRDAQAKSAAGKSRRKKGARGGAAASGAAAEAPEPPTPAAPAPAPAAVRIGPRLQFVNGKMIVDRTSLVVGPRSAEQLAADEAAMEVVDDTGTFATSSSFSSRAKALRWTEDETRCFYKGLRTFGLDFGLLATLFPRRRRSQIKAMYSRELRARPALVNAALMCPLPPDVDTVRERIKEHQQREKDAERAKRVGVGAQSDSDDEPVGDDAEGAEEGGPSGPRTMRTHEEALAAAAGEADDADESIGAKTFDAAALLAGVSLPAARRGGTSKKKQRARAAAAAAAAPAAGSGPSTAALKGSAAAPTAAAGDVEIEGELEDELGGDADEEEDDEDADLEDDDDGGLLSATMAKARARRHEHDD